MFNVAGGRLLRIAMLFSMICILALVIMAYFTSQAMEDVKEIALTPVKEGEQLPDMRTFYTQLIDNLKFGTVIGSLSGVLIAIVARYGFRETASNIADGMSARTTITHESGGSKVSTSEEVQAR